jgi:hypothetical protein
MEKPSNSTKSDALENQQISQNPFKDFDETNCITQVKPSHKDIKISKMNIK